MDRCALFVDAGYLLADGAMAVHGTRHRETVSWDYAGLLQLLGNLSRERTGLPLLRCYWYEATVEGRRAPEHEALADLPGLKLRLGRIRPGRREGVDSEIHRDLMTLARNGAIADAVLVSGDEDLGQVVSDAQDLGLRATVVHVAVDGNWTISRTLRQECDDLIEIGANHLRPYVNLLAGADSSSAVLSNGQASSTGTAIAPLPAGAHPSAPPASPIGSVHPPAPPQPAGGGSASEPAAPSATMTLPASPPSPGHQTSDQHPQGQHPQGQHLQSQHLQGQQSQGQHQQSQHGQPAETAQPPRVESAGQGGQSGQGAQGLGGPVQQGQSQVQHGREQHGHHGQHGQGQHDQQGHGPQTHGQQGHGPQGQGQQGQQQGQGQQGSPGPSPQSPQPGPAATTMHAAPVPAPVAPATGAAGAGAAQQPAVQPPGSSGPHAAQAPGSAQFPPQPPASFVMAQQPPQTQGQQQQPQQQQSLQLPAVQQGAPALSEAVTAAHKEGQDFGESVARDAPALWLEAVLARKPRMPSDLEARLLQGSSLPIDFLLHDEVRHALRRGFWDALERSRR